MEFDMTAADSEREAREIGQLIRNYEKLTKLETDAARQCRQAPAEPGRRLRRRTMRSAGARNLRSALSECASSGQLTAVLASLDADDLVALVHDWLIWARDDQLPDERRPSGEPWRTWLILGGRGSGKTRSGSEWVRAQALGAPPLADASCRRIALVGETLHEARAGDGRGRFGHCWRSIRRMNGRSSSRRSGC